jgi:CRP-like cAMP-binding protein
MSQSEEHPTNPESILVRVDGLELECKKDQVVYAQGNLADFVFYVQDGRLKVSVVSEEG